MYDQKPSAASMYILYVYGFIATTNGNEWGGYENLILWLAKQETHRFFFCDKLFIVCKRKEKPDICIHSWHFVNYTVCTAVQSAAAICLYSLISWLKNNLFLSVVARFPLAVYYTVVWYHPAEITAVSPCFYDPVYCCISFSSDVSSSCFILCAFFSISYNLT